MTSIEHQQPASPAAKVRALAARFTSRIADPRFGGHDSPSGEAYALAMTHAAELALNLARDLDATDGAP